MQFCFSASLLRKKTWVLNGNFLLRLTFTKLNIKGQKWYTNIPFTPNQTCREGTYSHSNYDFKSRVKIILIGGPRMNGNLIYNIYI